MSAMQPTVPLAAAHKSLLVVGPDPEVEGALAAMLEPAGWKIRRAGANQDALLLAQSSSFDLIVRRAIPQAGMMLSFCANCDASVRT